MNRHFNLRPSIQVGLGLLFFGTLLVFQLSWGDRLDFSLRGAKLATLWACLLVFPVFALLAWNTRFAHFCARDRTRVAETRAGGYFGMFLLLLLMGLSAYAYFSASQ